ncbi:hypothetical protein Sjap_022639 [Stephania japonica]|uniref:Uncharacterized protein n=1 Tax=Stephania japonica TaxID=461633 RepID=A0AAP0EUM8_9MAGN
MRDEEQRAARGRERRGEERRGERAERERRGEAMSSREGGRCKVRSSGDGEGFFVLDSELGFFICAYVNGLDWTGSAIFH